MNIELHFLSIQFFESCDSLRYYENSCFLFFRKLEGVDQWANITCYFGSCKKYLIFRICRLAGDNFVSKAVKFETVAWKWTCFLEIIYAKFPIAWFVICYLNSKETRTNFWKKITQNCNPILVAYNFSEVFFSVHDLDF